MSFLSETIRRMTEADLELVLSWRNHPDVRRYMYTGHEITLENHTRWFSEVSKDAKRHLLIYQDRSIPMGFINIHEIASGGIADWGFYAAPNSPKGTGRSLGNAALRYAFTEVGLHKLCGQVIAFNERSIKFHQSLGFLQEAILRQQHFDGHQYQDVYCFGLLAQEWLAKH